MYVFIRIHTNFYPKYGSTNLSTNWHGNPGIHRACYFHSDWRNIVLIAKNLLQKWHFLQISHFIHYYSFKTRLRNEIVSRAVIGWRVPTCDLHLVLFINKHASLNNAPHFLKNFFNISHHFKIIWWRKYYEKKYGFARKENTEKYGFYYCYHVGISIQWHFYTAHITLSFKLGTCMILSLKCFVI